MESVVTDKISLDIINRIQRGKTIESMCMKYGFTRREFWKHVFKNRELFESFLEQIFDMIIGGKTVNEAVRAVGISNEIFWYYINSNAEYKTKFYAAKSAQVEKMAEELLELTDAQLEQEGKESKYSMAQVVKRRLQVDTRKWILSKVLPKMYGDKLSVSTNQDVDIEI